jgi:hypothetical protein
MNAVLDALGKVISLSLLPWWFVMVPISAALARRVGWRPLWGALAALVPIPFFGWAVVGGVWYHRRRVPRVVPTSSSGVDDWMTGPHA